MKAMHCLAYGDPPELAIAAVDDPQPGPGEVLAEVESVGIGYFDAVLLGGRYQEKPALPFIPGREFAGRIIDVGADVDRNLIGRRIAGLTFKGSLAERAVAKAHDCMVMPPNLPDDMDGAFLSAYATSLYALESCGHMRPGERVLILGAAGTVGTAAIEIAKSFDGFVIAAASSPEKRAFCLQQGADLAIDYTAENWRRTMSDALGTGGVDLVVDSVGGALSETAFRCLNPGGRHLVVGFSSGEIGRLPLNLPLLKRANVVGVDWGGFMQKEPEPSRKLLERLSQLLAEGRIRPEPARILPVDALPALLKDLLARRNIGKPVIRVAGDPSFR